MKKFFLINSILISLFLYQSCTNTVCGELDSEYKKKIDSVENKFGDVMKVEHIPCEYRYIKVYSLTSNINDTILNSVHGILYNKKTQKGWLSLDVYDNNGKYLYSHNTNNQTYVRSGD